MAPTSGNYLVSKQKLVWAPSMPAPNWHQVNREGYDFPSYWTSNHRQSAGVSYSSLRPHVALRTENSKKCFFIPSKGKSIFVKRFSEKSMLFNLSFYPKLELFRFVSNSQPPGKGTWHYWVIRKWSIILASQPFLNRVLYKSRNSFCPF